LVEGSSEERYLEIKRLLKPYFKIRGNYRRFVEEVTKQEKRPELTSGNHRKVITGTRGDVV